MSTRKFQSYEQTEDSNGRKTKVTFFGSKSDMQSEMTSHNVGETGTDGDLVAMRLNQESADIWNLELEYVRDYSGVSIHSPEATVGKKTAFLRSETKELPLCKHSEYRTCMEYMLAAKKGVTTVPTWWENSTSQNTQDQNYKWVLEPDSIASSEEWYILKGRKPGFWRGTFTANAYVITIKEKCGSAKSAGTLVKNKLGKYGSPSETFGIGGDWKCEDVQVNWDGSRWVASLTWSRTVYPEHLEA